MPDSWAPRARGCASQRGQQAVDDCAVHGRGLTLGNPSHSITKYKPFQPTELAMPNRRNVLALAILGGSALFAHAAFAAGDCPPAGSAGIGSALLDKYVAAVNAHDTSSFPE